MMLSQKGGGAKSGNLFPPSFSFCNFRSTRSGAGQTCQNVLPRSHINKGVPESGPFSDHFPYPWHARVIRDEEEAGLVHLGGFQAGNFISEQWKAFAK